MLDSGEWKTNELWQRRHDEYQQCDSAGSAQGVLREIPARDGRARRNPVRSHPLGQKIYDNVSKEAWKMWVEHMKMIMNEYRLNLGTKEAQEFLIEQMDNYFFGEGAALPPDFVPPKAKA